MSSREISWSAQKTCGRGIQWRRRYMIHPAALVHVWVRTIGKFKRNLDMKVFSQQSHFNQVQSSFSGDERKSESGIRRSAAVTSAKAKQFCSTLISVSYARTRLCFVLRTKDARSAYGITACRLVPIHVRERNFGMTLGSMQYPPTCDVRSRMVHDGATDFSCAIFPPIP